MRMNRRSSIESLNQRLILIDHAFAEDLEHGPGLSSPEENDPQIL